MQRKFRFQDLEIWKDAVVLAHQLLDIAEHLGEKKYFRFSEQLRGASLSISNNIAEGSGSLSKKDFSNFLNIARRSAFENANMLIIFCERKLIADETCDKLLDSLDYLCRKITKFQRSLS